LTPDADDVSGGATLLARNTASVASEVAPRFLLRDRDASYGPTFRDRVQAMAIQEVVTAPRSPWQNAYVERIIGSIRRECLDHVIVFDEHHLGRVLSTTLNTTTEAEHISRSTRIVPSLGPYSRPLPAPLLPSQRSAVCTIATSVAQPEPFAATEPVTPSQCCASTRSIFASLERRRAQNTSGESASRESGALFDHRTPSTAAFIAKPIP
jgi:Integrase core domain